MNVKSICNVRSFTHLQIKKTEIYCKRKRKITEVHSQPYQNLKCNFLQNVPVNFFRKKILLFMYLFPISFALALKQESST